MGKWEEKRISSICKVISGYAFNSADFQENGIPVIKISNIGNGFCDLKNNPQYVDESFLYILNEKYIITKDSILISLTGSHITQPNSMVGRSCRYSGNDPLLLNQRAGRIIPKQGSQQGIFLYYVMQSQWIKEYIGLVAYGAANQANISPKTIENIKVKLPDLQTQKRIADILSAYDDLIENNNRRIELLEKAAQELYKEWFVRFRFPNYERIKFVNGLPEGWEVKRMQDFCYVTDGTHDTPKPIDEGVPLITGRCIDNGFIDFESAYCISNVDHEKIKKRSGLKTGDIIFSNIGTVGNTCLVDYKREFSVKNVIIFKPENEVITNYLYCLLTNTVSQEIFSVQTNGASQQFVGLTFMRRFKILVPKKELLNDFSDKIISIIELKRSIYNQNQNLKKQRDLLLPRMMSGRLEV